MYIIIETIINVDHGSYLHRKIEKPHPTNFPLSTEFIILPQIHHRKRVLTSKVKLTLSETSQNQIVPNSSRSINKSYASKSQ